MSRSSKRAAVIALTAGLPLTAGLVLAAGAGSSAAPRQAQPAQSGQGNQGQTTPNGLQLTPPQRRGTGTNYADVFLQKLAAQLGISVERLRSAAVTAGSATIDQGVQAGDISSDRAAELKGRLRQAPFVFGGRGGLGRGGRHHGGPGGSGRMHGDRMNGGPHSLDQSQPGPTNGTGTSTSGT